MIFTANSTALRQKLEEAAHKPHTGAEFDIHGELTAMLAEIGLTPSDAGGRITFEGLDPIVPSTFRLGAAAALGLVHQSIVAAHLHRLRGGPGQEIRVHLAQAIRRLAPVTERKFELLDGHPPPIEDASIRFLLRFYRTADGREVLPANLYPRMKQAMLELLECKEDFEGIAGAIGRRMADNLEDTFEQAGLVLCKVRTLAEFMREPVFDYLASLPLIEIEKIGESDPETLPPAGTMPLSGLRALGMGHVIAGAGVGRSLASLGADVLNLWRTGEFEYEAIYRSANVGMRSCLADPRTSQGYRTIRGLLRDADVFFANRRPGLLREFGLDAAAMSRLRPGIVHVTLSTFGEGGPWRNRVGFDQVAGSVCGMAAIEGTPTRAALPPIGIVNDYLTSWLAAAGAMAALCRRATEGGSYRVHVSLTRVALWTLSLGVFDKAYVRSVAGTPGDHELIPPRLFQAETPLGRYQGVTETVEMSVTPRSFSTVLVPRGAGPAVWLPFL